MLKFQNYSAPPLHLSRKSPSWILPWLFLCNLGHGRDDEYVNIFAFGLVLLGTHKLSVASSYTSGRPVHLRGFGLHLNYLTQVHIVYGAMQGSGKLIINFVFSFSFGVLFRGFHGLV